MLDSLNESIGGITKAMLEGAQAWKDHVCINPYRDNPDSEEYKDWNWGWGESQSYFEWLESLSDDTLQ